MLSFLNWRFGFILAFWNYLVVLHNLRGLVADIGEPLTIDSLSLNIVVAWWRGWLTHAILGSICVDFDCLWLLGCLREHIGCFKAGYY